MRLKPSLGRLALLGAALIWGTSFFILKGTLDHVPVYWALAFRFTLAFALLAVIFGRKWRALDRNTLSHGVFLGALLGLSYIVQTFGLVETSPGKNAFLTAVYCVLAPFMTWLFFRDRLSRWNWLAAAMCLMGIGLVSLEGDLSVSRGDALSLLSGVFYALHIVFISRYSAKEDPVMLTILQFGTSAVMCWGMSLATHEAMAPMPANAWSSLIYLAVFCTTIAMLLQNVGQSVTPTAQASILLALESVFGVLFSVLFAGEVVSPRLLCGFAVIFCAVIISETRLSFLFPAKEGKP